MFKSKEIKGLIAAGVIVLTNVACRAQLPAVEQNIRATIVANSSTEKVFVPENGFEIADFEKIARSTIRLEFIGTDEMTKNFYNSCTGVIIQNDSKSLTFLTAAHCLVSPSGMPIMTGNEDLRKFIVNVYFNGVKYNIQMLNTVLIDINSDIATIEIPSLIKDANVIQVISTSNLVLGSYVAVLGYPSVQGFNDINTHKFISSISSTGKFSVLSEANTSFYSQYFSKPSTRFGQIDNILVFHGNSGGGVFYKDPTTGKLYLIGVLSGANQSELTKLKGGRSNIVFSFATNVVPTSALLPQP